MTRAEKVAAAVVLADEGLTHSQIAARFGVANATVWKWLNPEKAREHNRRSNAKPERKAQKNEWTRRARCDPDRLKPCPECGGPTSEPVWGLREYDRCADCRRHRREERTQLIERLWAEGSKTSEIAQELGWTVGSVGAEISRLRAKGADRPYRRSPEQVQRIKEGWARVRQGAA